MWSKCLPQKRLQRGRQWDSRHAGGQPPMMKAAEWDWLFDKVLRISGSGQLKKMSSAFII
jgi:hypothetical protein